MKTQSLPRGDPIVRNLTLGNRGIGVKFERPFTGFNHAYKPII